MVDPSRLAVFLRDTLQVPRILGRFHDIRLHPRIPLRTILVAVFLMPFWATSTLLHLDTLLRSPQMLAFFGAPKKKRVVVSDTTLARVLTWLSPQESRAALLAPLPTLNREHLLQRRLVPDGPLRRPAVIDGSQMSRRHYLVATLLCGAIHVPVTVEPCSGRGQELSVAQARINSLPETLRETAPDLYLFDAYYFNRSTFNLVRSQDAHLLIKYSPHEKPDERQEAQQKLFRDVLEDARRLFAHPSSAVEPVEEASGFDEERWCSWSMKRVALQFADYPIQVYFLGEDYPKRKTNAHVETWIVTTDFRLSFREAREAAHLRWQIENNEFKRLSHLSGTKRFYFKDARPFFAMLRLFCLALTVLAALLYSLQRTKQEWKALLDGCKFTWKTAFSQIQWRWGKALEVLLTTGF